MTHLLPLKTICFKYPVNPVFTFFLFDLPDNLDLISRFVPVDWCLCFPPQLPKRCVLLPKRIINGIKNGIP